jgi:hypothetical protein
VGGSIRRREVNRNRIVHLAAQPDGERRGHSAGGRLRDAHIADRDLGPYAEGGEVDRLVDVENVTSDPLREEEVPGRVGPGGPRSVVLNEVAGNLSKGCDARLARECPGRVQALVDDRVVELGEVIVVLILNRRPVEELEEAPGV